MVQPGLSTQQKEDEPPARFYLSLVTKFQLFSKAYHPSAIKATWRTKFIPKVS